MRLLNATKAADLRIAVREGVVQLASPLSDIWPHRSTQRASERDQCPVPRNVPQRTWRCTSPADMSPGIARWWPAGTPLALARSRGHKSVAGPEQHFPPHADRCRGSAAGPPMADADPARISFAVPPNGCCGCGLRGVRARSVLRLSERLPGNSPFFLETRCLENRLMQ